MSQTLKQFACGYCGANQIVERSGGTVSLELVSGAIRKVQAGTDKTAAELALKRLYPKLEAAKGYLREAEAQTRAARNRSIGVVLLLVLVGLVFFIGLIQTETISGVAAAVLLVLPAIVIAAMLSHRSFASEISGFERHEDRARRHVSNIEVKVARNERIVD